VLALGVLARAAALGMIAGQALAQTAEPKPADKAPPPSDAGAPQAAPGEKKPLSGPGKTAAPAPPEYPVGPEAKIEKKPDGTMLVDDRFVLKGEGTLEKPYEVPWEMLVSAQESFAPDKKLKTIPGRVKMLDGKQVRITGNILFPLFVKKPKELLLMLNQWDGCCIGVPPTPYDAIEAKLIQGVSDEEKFATQGQLEGKLGVKPFLTGDWLVGLYVMEGAKFTVKEMGSPNVPQGGIPPN
jgi:hypothetical protein